MPFQTGSVDKNGLARTADGKLYVTLGSGSAIDSPTLTGAIAGAEAKAGILRLPMISAPTGTMANNGAITLGTALDATYANCYLYLPANAISAGSAVGWYYAEMSSATAGIVYNNTYSSGEPSVPSSPTAFVTTGPGAYTGETTEHGVVFTIPILQAGVRLRALIYHKNNNSAGTKTPRIRLNGAAGTVLVGSAQTTNTETQYESLTFAITQAKQRSYGRVLTGGAAANLQAITTTTVDFSAATDIRFTTQKNTATDYAILMMGEAAFMQ